MTEDCPPELAASAARARRASARSRSPSRRWERASTWSIVARYGLSGVSPSHAILRVPPHLLNPVATQAGRAGTPRCPRSCCRRRASPSSRSARRPPPSAPCRPGGRPRRASAPRARRSPGSVRARPLASNHSIQRITVVPRPLAHTGLASCNTRRATRSASPAAWAWSMAASGWPFVLAPGRRPEVELGDVGRLASPQLRRQQVAEQLVIAEPLPPAVERHHQQVAALQPLEDVARSLSTGDRVAERTAHAVEDRRAGEEQDLGP